jgi:hypothetical protein
MYALLRQVLRTIVVLYLLLFVNSLCGLLYLPKVDIKQGLADLYAILNILININ